MKLRQSKAFTLIELMIVIAIIGIMAAIVIPQITRYSEKIDREKIEQPVKPQVKKPDIKKENTGETQKL